MKNYTGIAGVVCLLVLVGFGCQGEGVKVVGGEPSEAVNEGGYYDEVITHRGKKMLVRPSDIIDGGRGYNGSEAIDEPTFVSVAGAEAEGYLYNDIYGVSIEDGDTSRFYSNQILAWHQVVEDEIEGRKVAVTYSPLVDYAVPFYVDEERDFVMSGYIWNNNTLLHDRVSDTLFSQFLWKGVYGEDAGVELEAVEHEIISWGAWKARNPGGLVLSSETGHALEYGVSPYGGYITAKAIYFPLTNEILPAKYAKNIVYGVVVNGVAKAYDINEIIRSNSGVKSDVVGGEKIAVTVNGDGAVNAYTRTDEGVTEEMIPIKGTYWFLWAVLYPDTEFYGEIRKKGLVDGAFTLEEDEGDDESEGIRIDIDPEFGVSDFGEINLDNVTTE